MSQKQRLAWLRAQLVDDMTMLAVAAVVQASVKALHHYLAQAVGPKHAAEYVHAWLIQLARDHRDEWKDGT